MKDLILIQLYKLSKYGLINNLYVLYYKSAIKFLEIIFSRIDYIEQVGLKGSFGKVYFVPVFSDLDFFVVGNKNAVTIKKLDRLFKFTSLIFPIVKDYDFYTKTEAKLLLSFGDLKFIDPGSWTTLKGESFSSQYRYHPRKFYLDIVHEIHFQFEWLFRNLQTRTSKEVYKSLNIQRQYDKVSDLLNYLHDHQSYTIRRRPFKPNYRWVDYSNEYIIQKFNDLLERSVQIRTLKKIFFKEFQGRDLEPILEQEYFQNNLVLMDSGFVYSGKLHYFTRSNFELFYFSGAIDSFMVYDWARENEDDKLGCFFVRAQYYCRLIEGRFNSRHDRIYLEKRLPEFLNDAKFVENMIPNYLTPPSNVFGKKVVLRVFEARKRNGYELEKEIMGTNLSSETTNLSFLNVVLNDGSFQNKNFQLLENRSGSVIESSILNIYLRTIQEHLCYEGTLLEYGISWCFGAKEILVLDYRLELSDQVLQTFLDESILDGNFKITRPTHQFVQNYIIAASKISIQKIPFSKLTNLNFYIAEIIQAIIQGKVGELDISQKQMLKEWDVFKYLGDVEYWSIDLSTKFCELNTTALNIIPLINSLIEQNKFGIFNVKEKEKDLWLEIGYLLSSNNYHAAKTSVLNNLERFRLSAASIFLYRDIEIVVQSHQEGSLVMTPMEGVDTCFHFFKEGFYRGKLKKKYSVSESGFYTFDFQFRSEDLKRVSFINVEITEERFKNSGSKKDIIKLQLNTDFKLITFLEKGTNTVEVDFVVQTESNLELMFSIELAELIKYWELDESSMQLEGNTIIPQDKNIGKSAEIQCTEFQLYQIDNSCKLNLESSSTSFPSHIDIDQRTIYAYSCSRGYSDLRLNFNFDSNLIKKIKTYSRCTNAKIEWSEIYSGGVVFSPQGLGTTRFDIPLFQSVEPFEKQEIKFKFNLKLNTLETFNIITPDARVFPIENNLSLILENPTAEPYQFLTFEFQLEEVCLLGRHFEVSIVEQKVIDESPIKWIESLSESVKFETNQKTFVESFIPLGFEASSDKYVGNKIISYYPFQSEDEFEITHSGVNVSNHFLIYKVENYLEIYPREDLCSLEYTDEFILKFKMKAEPGRVYGLERQRVELMRPSEESYQYQKSQALDAMVLYPGFHKFVVYLNKGQTTDIALVSKAGSIDLPVVHIEENSIGVYHLFMPSVLDCASLSTNVEISKVDHLFYPVD